MEIRLVLCKEIALGFPCIIGLARSTSSIYCLPRENHETDFFFFR